MATMVTMVRREVHTCSGRQRMSVHAFGLFFSDIRMLIKPHFKVLATCYMKTKMRPWDLCLKLWQCLNFSVADTQGAIAGIRQSGPHTLFYCQFTEFQSSRSGRMSVIFDILASVRTAWLCCGYLVATCWPCWEVLLHTEAWKRHAKLVEVPIIVESANNMIDARISEIKTFVPICVACAGLWWVVMVGNSSGLLSCMLLGVMLPLPRQKQQSPHIPCGPNCEISGCPLLRSVTLCYRCVGLFQIEENGWG